MVLLGLLVTATAGGLVWQAAGPAPGDRATASALGQPAMLDVRMAGLPLDVPASADPSAPPASAAPAPSASTAAATSPTPAPATLAAAPAPAAASPAGSSDYQQRVLDLVNVQRVQHGCGPLTANAKLHTAAQHQSDDMAARNFFDHTNPDGAGPQQRIDAAGYHWSTWGENIARGQHDPAAVMTAWMNSPGHRANILNCAFKEFGLGVHLGTGGPWWTQDFGAP